MIPEGGSASDGLLFVPEKNRVRVFNVCSGLWIRDIAGDGGLSGYLGDVLISMTGPGGTAELYVADYGNHRVVVVDPMTGGHIRSIGMGRGSGIYEDVGVALFQDDVSI
jgi:DNA-binding beta-propeller fold protein YncE